MSPPVVLIDPLAHADTLILPSAWLSQNGMSIWPSIICEQ
jgi:hypothetical protein